MTDLVPKGTGNSRFLRSNIPADITFTDFVAMLRNGTFPVDFAGLNSAGVAVVGSAYNKANVLPDDVCNGLGIPTTAEPKDAFVAANKKKWRELTRITTSQQWTVPDGVYQIGAFMMSGGEGGYADGSSGNTAYATGGNAGRVRCIVIDVTPGQKLNIIIGAGGIGGSYESRKETYPTPSGDTSIDDYSTAGRDSYTYAVSAQTSTVGAVGLYRPLESGYLSPIYDALGNIFDPEMLIGSVGGSCYQDTSESEYILSVPTEGSLGIGGTASNGNGVATTAANATGYGNGGGAACVVKSYAKAAAGNGSPGIVIIYV